MYGLTGQGVLLTATWGPGSVLASIEDHLLLSRVFCCSYTMVTTTGHFVGKDTQCCTGMLGERISCQKTSIPAKICTKKEKAVLASGWQMIVNSHQSLWGVCLHFLASNMASHMHCTSFLPCLPTYLPAFPPFFLLSFLPFLSFSACLSFLFGNILTKPTFGLPCLQHYLSSLASSTGHVGRENCLSVFHMDLHLCGHVCLSAWCVEQDTVVWLQVASRSFFN